MKVSLEFNVSDEASLSDLMEVLSLAAKINTTELEPVKLVAPVVTPFLGQATAVLAPEPTSAVVKPLTEADLEVDDETAARIPTVADEPAADTQRSLPPGVPGQPEAPKRRGRPPGSKNVAAATSVSVPAAGPPPGATPHVPAMPRTLSTNGTGEPTIGDVNAAIVALQGKIGFREVYARLLKADKWPSNGNEKPSWTAGAAAIDPSDYPRVMEEIAYLDMTAAPATGAAAAE